MWLMITILAIASLELFSNPQPVLPCSMWNLESYLICRRLIDAMVVIASTRSGFGENER